VEFRRNLPNELVRILKKAYWFGRFLRPSGIRKLLINKGRAQAAGPETLWY